MCQWSRKIINPKGNILMLLKLGFLSKNSSPPKKGSFNLNQDVFKIRTLAHCVLYWRRDSMFAGGAWSSRRAVNGQRSGLSNESRLIRKIDWFWSLGMRNKEETSRRKVPSWSFSKYDDFPSIWQRQWEESWSQGAAWASHQFQAEAGSTLCLGLG